MRFDRDELLARTDLGALADELLGGHTGNGRSARWPSPVPDHPQTGRTPPMSIFVDQRGVERWTCFATGASGTAIDLVITATGRDVGDAIMWLAERARLDRPPPERPPIPRRRPPERQRREPSVALSAYVEACERILWRPEGATIRRWLIEERCLEAEILRHNRVGADPGLQILRRAAGLPRHGAAAVFPALDDNRQAVYLQARYLEPPAGRGKYDNPNAQHGSNPRLTVVESPCAPPGGPNIVTEGMPDALAVATIGYTATAILGAGLPDRRVAERIAQRHGLVVVAFDADDAGRAGASRLAGHLRDLGRSDVAVIEPVATDLNSWLVSRSPATFRRQLDLSIGLAVTGVSQASRGRSIA